MGLDLGGLANAYQGFRQGQDQELARQQLEKDRSQQEAVNGQNKALFDARMEDINRERELRTGLSDAALPQPDPNANTPEAVTSRQASVYRSKGAPDKALNLENAALNQKRTQAQFTQDQTEIARRLQDEGIFDSAKALRTGDATGFANAFNKNGKFKINGEPEITKEDRDIPGIGTVPTYTAKFQLVHPDGKVTEETRNSHDLSMQLMPYEKSLEIQRRGTDSDNKANYQMGLIDAKNAALDAKIESAKLRAEQGGGAGGRIQKTFADNDGYMVGVFRDGTSKRLTDPDGKPIRSDNIEKRIDTLAKNLQANSREYRRMPYADVRKAAQGILSGGEQDPNAGLATPTTRTAPAKSGAADYSNLWK